MYGPVAQRKVSGIRGEALALLLEYREATQHADNTYDQSPRDFLPDNWEQRLEDLLSKESLI
jgi:hypothetical protein